MKNWDSLVVSLWCGKFETPSCIDREVKTYRTFGNHDMIIISPVEGKSATDKLKNMWNQTNEYSKNISSGDSIHNLYAINDSDDCVDFWNSNSPYLYISSIQNNFNDNYPFADQLSTLKSEICELFNKIGFIYGKDFIFYNSLDCGDMLLFFKTQQYNLGSNIIHQMTIKLKSKHYSYSMCGIDVESAIETTSAEDEIIPKVAICSVLADSTNYNNWFLAFQKQYPHLLSFSNEEKTTNFEHLDEIIHLARLGSEDVCINIFNCKMNHFLNMLYSDDGVFCHNNKLVHSSFSRLRIMFDTNIEDIVPSLRRSPSQGFSLIESLNSKWKPILNQYANPCVNKAICELLAASENLEHKEFAFDVQGCIRNAFPLFVEKINSYTDHQDEYSNFDFNNDLILFTTGLMSIANGSLHADKLFINVPGFNAVTCEAPAKLLIYYTVFIQKLVDILNDSTCEYRFLLCPDLYLGIEVVSLFNYSKEESQLLKARIPINKLFDPQKILMELSHEAAHFVGIKYRKRKERVDLLAKTIAYTLADRLVRPKQRTKLDSLPEDDTNLGEKTIITLFIEDSDHISIEALLDSSWNGIVQFIKLELLKNIDMESNLFLLDIQEQFTNNIASLLSDINANRLLNKVCEILTEKSNNDNIDAVFLLTKIIERHISEILLDEYKVIIEKTCSLFSESFADLVMLSITQDPYLYLKNIYEAECDALYRMDVLPWRYSLIGEMRFERILSVVQVLGYNLDELKNDTDDLYCNFIDSIKQYSNDYYEDHKAISSLSLKTTVEYLTLCREELENSKENLTPILKLYHSATKEDNMNGFIKSFQQCAFDFCNKII